MRRAGCSTPSRRRSRSRGARSSSAPRSGSPPAPSDADTLLRDADLAMYRAKADGKGRYAMFEPEHAHRGRRAAGARGRPEAGDRARRAGARLPADLQPAAAATSPGSRRWSAGATRQRGLVGPEPVHPAGRGERPDPRPRALGAAGGVPAGRALAGPVPGATRGSRSASTSPAPSSASRAGRRGGRGAGRRPARPAGLMLEITETSLMEDIEASAAPARRAQGPRASTSRSTTSAPATRRSSTLRRLPARRAQDRRKPSSTGSARTGRGAGAAARDRRPGRDLRPRS